MKVQAEIRNPKAEGRPKSASPLSRITHHASRITHRESAGPFVIRHSSFVIQRAFTLIEVMVACGIFFMAAFAILALVATTLRNARGLQKGYVDAGMAASQVFELFKTNKDPDLSASGDFGDTLPDYSWEAQSSEADTNGLLLVDIVVNHRGSREPVDKLEILVYQANVKSSPLGPGPRFHP